MKPKRIKWIDPHLAGGGETLRNPANVAVLADKMRRERGTGKHPWPDDLPPLFVLPEPGVDSFFVLDGNHRLVAALQAGLSRVPVVVVPYRGWARLSYDEGWPRDEAIEKLTGWEYPMSWWGEGRAASRRGQAALDVDRRSPGLFEKAFKQWLRSEAVYRLADKHAGERSGCTWAEGWCFSLAEVLHRWGGWPKGVVLGWVGQPDGSGFWQTEHVVVATPWGFLDGEGFRQRGALLAALRRGRHGPRRRLQLLSAEKAQEEYGDVLEEEGGEAYPPAMVRTLLRRLRADFGKPEDWGLR